MTAVCTTPSSDPITVSIPKAAALLDVSEHALRQAIRDRELPASRVGSSLIIRPEDLRVWSRGLLLASQPCPQWCERPEGHRAEETIGGIRFRRHRKTFGTVVIECEEDDQDGQPGLGPLVPTVPNGSGPAWLRDVASDAPLSGWRRTSDHHDRARRHHVP